MKTSVPATEKRHEDERQNELGALVAHLNKMSMKMAPMEFPFRGPPAC